MTRRTLRIALLALFAVLLVTSAVATAATRGHARSGHHRPPVSTCATFRVNGHVANPLKLHVDDLRTYPAHDVTVSFQAGGAPVTHEYVGALLTDVLATAEPTFDPAVKNDSLNFWVSATGADAYSALVAWGEIDPSFGAKPVLLAYEVDGTDLCSAGPTLVVPGDIKGGRYVSTIVRVHVGRAGSGVS
jgi:DMSO/TMAO reductase YedYZ molybdopterin-dependent catalytic subunit